jgi:hypothetical protein
MKGREVRLSIDENGRSSRVVLFSERKHQEKLRAAEAAGNVLWTAQFDERARTRLWQTFALAFDIQPSSYDDPWFRVCLQLQRDLVWGDVAPRIVEVRRWSPA